MTSAMALPKRKQKARQHAYFVVRTMIDPHTGAEVGCMVPSSKADRAMLREKGLRNGDRVRMPVRKPRSIAFDEMDEGEFHKFWYGICSHLIERYWPSLDEEAIAEMIDLTPEVVA